MCSGRVVPIILFLAGEVTMGLTRRGSSVVTT